jgi:hypothetical protein
MSQLLSLGAINKNTGEYVYPKIANKKDEYICPECNKDLILVNGEVRVHHFRHKVDCINPCHHYGNPTESQIHKEAKNLLKSLLERKIPISFIRSCCECNRYDEFEIPVMTETSNIVIEHRFVYNGLSKQADVAYINDGMIIYIFEIYNTHKTSSENRPEPWFEVDAKTLIKMANAISLSSLQIPCIRCEKCVNCIEKYMNKIKEYDIERYVRIKLGQRIFPTPSRKLCEKPEGDYCRLGTLCDNCKYNEWYDDEWKLNGHKRFDYDARSDFQYNKEIIDLFDKDFMRKAIVIHTHKGKVDAHIVSKIIYNKHNLWDETRLGETNNLPVDETFELDGYSTVEIIKKLIEYCRFRYNRPWAKFTSLPPSQRGPQIN